MHVYVKVLAFVIAGSLLTSPALAQSAAEDQYSGEGCTTVARLNGNTSKSSEPFFAGRTNVRITYATNPNNNLGFNSTDISLIDDTNETSIDAVSSFEGRDGQFITPVEGGRYRVDVSTFEQSYIIAVQIEGTGDEECAEDPGEGGNPEPPEPSPTPSPQPTPIDPVDPVEPPKDVIMPPKLVGKELPVTGGASTVPLAAGALVGAGLLLLRTVVHRS